MDVVAIRLSNGTAGEIDAWAEQRQMTRSDAIRRWIENGLDEEWMPRKVGRTSAKSAARASRLAGKEIDRQADQSASVEERASRKRRLLKGPKEFRDMRQDHRMKPKTTGRQRPPRSIVLLKNPAD
jgi:hypothetical protein